jgi:hypothetical protein
MASLKRLKRNKRRKEMQGIITINIRGEEKDRIMDAFIAEVEGWKSNPHDFNEAEIEMSLELVEDFDDDTVVTNVDIVEFSV